MKERKRFSTEFEPALHGDSFKADPAEQRIKPLDGRQGEMETVRDSVYSEPAVAGPDAEANLAEWIARKREQCSRGGNLAFLLLAALLSGPFAVVGAFLNGRYSIYGLGYAVLFAPIIEELLKQSGMVYVLERQPYRIVAPWQFITSAVIAALVFASIENVLYTFVYVGPEDVRSWTFFLWFRWTVPTTMHITASVIASLGLVRVWRKQLADGKMADLSAAFPHFVAAMVLHGGYNFVAIPLSILLIQ
ncbi:MAG: PrsW family intramembrane metalloprotease [Sedimentisphaerales bacterium]|nr:PrsW family intramembrane metalloprotease [Sedimentisphaerales bacterium]